MGTISLRYSFRQPFRASADDAFAWCTDFRPEDGALFQDGRSRTVRRLGPGALMMTDAPARGTGGPRIARLVRVFPEERAWTNTHLSGPFRYSQFWYRVEPDGRHRSRLVFHGLKLEPSSRAVPPEEIERRARAEGRSDARTWRTLLAPALDADLAR
jgi:hypothetical protein